MFVYQNITLKTIICGTQLDNGGRGDNSRRAGIVIGEGGIVLGEGGGC